MYHWSKLKNFRLAKGSHDDARGGEMCLVEAPILHGRRIDRYFPGRSRSPMARIGPVDLMRAWSGHGRVNVRGDHRQMEVRQGFVILRNRITVTFTQSSHVIDVNDGDCE